MFYIFVYSISILHLEGLFGIKTKALNCMFISLQTEHYEAEKSIKHKTETKCSETENTVIKMDERERVPKMTA